MAPQTAGRRWASPRSSATDRRKEPSSTPARTCSSSHRSSEPGWCRSDPATAGRMNGLIHLLVAAPLHGRRERRDGDSAALHLRRPRRQSQPRTLPAYTQHRHSAFARQRQDRSRPSPRKRKDRVDVETLLGDVKGGGREKKKIKKKKKKKQTDRRILPRSAASQTPAASRSQNAASSSRPATQASRPMPSPVMASSTASRAYDRCGTDSGGRVELTPVI